MWYAAKSRQPPVPDDVMHNVRRHLEWALLAAILLLTANIIAVIAWV